MILISRTWTLLHYTGYAINIGLNFKNIFDDGKTLWQEHHSRTTKVLILFDMIMNCIDIGAIGYTFHNKRSENTYTHLHPALKGRLDTELHQEGKQLALRAFHAWHQSELPEATPPLSLQKSQEAFEKLNKNVQGYRRKNAQFEIAQYFSLASRLVRHVMRNGIRARVDLLVQLILEKATAILSFHGKARCNIDLQPISSCIHLLSPLRKISNIASFFIGISMVLEPFMSLHSIPWRGLRYTRFTLPPDLASGGGYRKIPEEYYNQEPFKNQPVCEITKLPITKALFIWKKHKIYCFEKEALLKVIFAAKSEGRRWIIPGTEIAFEAHELYEYHSLDTLIGNELANRK